MQRREKAGIKYRKDEIGITLIALVVTIVILLILSGVTINMLLGEDGNIDPETGWDLNKVTKFPSKDEPSVNVPIPNGFTDIHSRRRTKSRRRICN